MSSIPKKHLRDIALVTVVAALGACGSDESSAAPAEDTVADTNTGECVPACTGLSKCEGGQCVAVTAACDGYCDAMIAECTGDNSQYSSREDCVAWCESAPWVLGEPGDGAASLACHQEAAMGAGDDPSRCAAAGPLSSTCGGPCAGYCEVALSLCSFPDAPLYAGEDSCYAACEQFPPGAATTDDTLACRSAQLLALTRGTLEATGACEAASPSGGTVCVEPAPLNDTCATAMLVSTFPFTHSGDTSGAESDFDTGAGCCLGDEPDPDSAEQCSQDGAAFGAGVADVVFRIEPKDDGVYTVTLTGEEPRPQLLYAVTDCEKTATSCVGTSLDLLGQDPAVFTVTLTGGVPTWLILDGRYGQDLGPYTLSIKAPCTLNCDGRQCGDDGCGGTCGECDDGLVCDTAGQCGEPSPTCSPAGVLACGDVKEVGNDGEGVLPRIDVSGCAAEDGAEISNYASTPEGAWTLDIADGVRATLSIPSPSDLDLIVLEDAGAGCVASEATCVASSPSEVSFDGDGTHYLVVDSPNGAIGSTTVTVTCCTKECDGKVCGDDACGGSCGECADGEFCTEDGQCTCTPDCGDRLCGDDGCGGSCGECGPEESCSEEGLCLPTGSCADYCGVYDETRPCQCDDECSSVGDCCPDLCDVCSDDVVTSCTQCVPTCSEDVVCGDDGCGGSCGECGEGLVCSSFGTCDVPAPSCDGACGGLGQDGTCWCDAECFENGDCCVDVCGACTEDFPGACGECVPDCTDLACGDDGCGGSCGTCDGGGSCDAGVCLPAGDACEAALALTAGQPATGDLAAFSANHALDLESDCVFDAETDVPGVEGVWRFTAATEGWFDVVLAPDAADLTLWASAGCDDLAYACEAIAETGGAGEPEGLSVYLAAGESLVFIVDEPRVRDPEDTTPLTYSLTVTAFEPCFAICDDRECGDDGCGGSCGECEAGSACSAEGQCVCAPSCDGKVCGDDGCGGLCGSPCGGGLVCADDGSACLVPGDSCKAPLALVDSVSGDTTSFNDDVDPSTCGSTSGAWPDAVYTFEAPVHSVYSFSFAHVNEDGHPQTIVVSTSCPTVGEGCVGPGNDLYGGGETRAVLRGEEPVYVVVDGAAEGATDAGPFTMTATFEGLRCLSQETLACGEPVFGILEDPGATIGDYACGATGRQAQEAAYRFVATETGPVTLLLGDTEGVDLDFFVLEDGGECDPTACLGSATTADDDGETLTVNVTAGQSYFVVVDGAAPATAFFSLTLECFAVTPGESCDAPLEVGALPWEAVVSEGVSDDLVVSVCEGNAESTGAPDAVLSFTPPQDGLYRVSLPAWTEGVGPSVFAVTGGCGLSVTGEGTPDEELLGLELCYGGTRGDAPLEVYLAGGETVFIALERLPGDAPGPQTVRVESACTPDCEGRDCGDDGCGGSCGDCADGSFCLEEAGICF